MRISDWSSDVCSSDLGEVDMERAAGLGQSAIPAIDAGDGKDALIGGGIGGRGGRAVVTDRRDDQHAALLCARYGGRQQLISAERRRGTEWCSTGRTRWSTDH